MENLLELCLVNEVEFNDSIYDEVSDDTFDEYESYNGLNLDLLSDQDL